MTTRAILTFREWAGLKREDEAYARSGQGGSGVAAVQPVCEKRQRMARHDCEVCTQSCTQQQLATCGVCDYHVCKPCCHRWLLGSNEDARCMNCKHNWSHTTMCQMFGMAFVNGPWKRHRQEVLFDREVAMLTETQPYVDQEVQKRENKKRVAELEAEKIELKRQARQIDEIIATIRVTNVPLASPDKKQSVHRCARHGCEGFLGQGWKCLKCSSITCKDCGMLKQMGVGQTAPPQDVISAGDGPGTHVCKEADKASMELIRKDSRQCVSCGAWTFRVHGCNQMFCIACHTAWDWRTGRRVTGTIHNPEYFRLRREANNGTLTRDLNDVPCGGTPSLQEINSTWPSADDPRFHKCVGVLRLILHLREVEIPLFPAHPGYHENRDLRVSYMLSEMTAEEMKIKLQQREKKNHKTKDVHDVLNMFIVTASDLLRQVVIDPDRFKEIYAQMYGLVTHFNESMTGIAKRYGCVVPNIYSHSTASVYWRVRHTHIPVTHTHATARSAATSGAATSGTATSGAASVRA